MRIIITSLIAAVAFGASPAIASTIVLSPTTVTVTKGQTFTVTVSVEPAGAKIYTVKSALSYPAATLEVVNFAFASGWMPLTMAGYDSTDNASGLLVKTAGLPGGLSTAQSLGIVTFRAKESGTATIAVTASSLAYDSQSKNTLSGTQGSLAATITSSAPVTAVTDRETQTPELASPQGTERSTAAASEEEPAATSTDALATPAAVAEQVAAAGFLEENWVAIAIGLLILGGLAVGLYLRKGRT